MKMLQIDFSKTTGKIKPMHSVNNGPAGSECRGTSNLKYFCDAKIPYMRNHDASFYSGYGGEHTVDVHAIFKNFDADENNPDSYSFEATDNYLKKIAETGGECFYRLGSKIEHETKFGTYPPKDFAKWARICEHIILHYNEGWAKGFHYNIKYWEIWNEPDCADPAGSNPCWQGTFSEFCDFFVTAFKNLKSKFPHLKIGGPALMNTWRDEYNIPFFEALKANNIVLDFYSFHGYAKFPHAFYEQGEKAYELLQKYGVEDKTELILNEWNYVHGWVGEDFRYSIKAIKGLKGSSFIAASMCEGQKSKLDQMMYYDARPSGFNGMFSTDLLDPLKGYYPFKMYSILYDMDSAVYSEYDGEDIYSVAAKSKDKCGVMLTYYSEDDTLPDKSITIHFDGVDVEGNAEIEYYLLDENNDMELVKKEKLTQKVFDAKLDISLHSSYLIVISATE